MSKVGKKPIPVPEEVEINIEKGDIIVKGPKGSLSFKARPEIKVDLQQKDGKKQLMLTRKNNSKLVKSLHGLTRTLIANMIDGVINGYNKTLKIVGTGYRVQQQGKTLVFSLGFSHPVKMDSPKGIEFSLKGNNQVTVSGIDKQLVGQTAADMRQLKKPDAYKGKGIRYIDEIVKTKPGKAAKTAAA